MYDKEEGSLHAGSVDGLHVNDKLTTLVGDDENTNTTTSAGESLGQSLPEVGLVNDLEALLDITGLGHGDNNTVLEVKDSVLLEDWTKHCLNDDAGAWVGDERRLLVQLLGEEINTQVSVLAGGG
jgi:hypothetical protein